jgi:hypothetical protein
MSVLVMSAFFHARGYAGKRNVPCAFPQLQEDGDNKFLAMSVTRERYRPERAPDPARRPSH